MGFHPNQFRLSTVFWTSTAILMSVVGCCYATDDLPPKCLQALISRRAQIHTIRARCVENLQSSGTENEGGRPNVLSQEMLYYRDGCQKAVHQGEKDEDGWQVSWDGATCRYLFREGEGVLSGIVSAKSTSVNKHALACWIRVGGVPPAELPRLYTTVEGENDVVDGMKCNLVCFYSKRNTNPDKKPFIRIWLAPDLGFEMVRYESLSVEGKVWARYDFKVQRTESGFWFPREIVKKFPQLGQEQHFAVTDVELNLPVEDAELRVSFPKGTHVANELTNELWVVGESVGTEDAADIEKVLALPDALSHDDGADGETIHRDLGSNDNGSGIEERDENKLEEGLHAYRLEAPQNRRTSRLVPFLLLGCLLFSGSFVAFFLARRGTKGENQK